MDPRIARTRHALRDALFALAREHSLDEISVTDIAERAGVNRSTYYQHYSDKDTLLADALDAATEAAADPGGATVIGPADAQAVLIAYLRHVREHAALYERVLGDTGSATIQARMRGYLEGVLLARLETTDGELRGLPLPVAAASIAGAAQAIIRRWLMEQPPAPTDVAAGWIWQVLDNHGVFPDGFDRP